MNHDHESDTGDANKESYFSTGLTLISVPIIQDKIYEFNWKLDHCQTAGGLCLEYPSCSWFT